MLAPLTILEVPAQPAAVIHIRIPREQIQEVMEPAIGEVMAAVRAQGIGPIGPVFAHHFDMEPGIFNFEVGVPVRGALQPVGRVRTGERPGGKIAHTVYTGPYEGLGDAWGTFMEEIRVAGHTPSGHLWENYLDDPAAGTAPSDYRTELNCVLA